MRLKLKCLFSCRHGTVRLLMLCKMECQKCIWLVYLNTEIVLLKLPKLRWPYRNLHSMPCTVQWVVHEGTSVPSKGYRRAVTLWRHRCLPGHLTSEHRITRTLPRCCTYQNWCYQKNTTATLLALKPVRVLKQGRKDVRNKNSNGIVYHLMVIKVE